MSCSTRVRGLTVWAFLVCWFFPTKNFSHQILFFHHKSTSHSEKLNSYSPVLPAAPAIKAEFLAAWPADPQSNDKLLSTAHQASTEAQNTQERSRTSQRNSKTRYSKASFLLHINFFLHYVYFPAHYCYCCIAQSWRLTLSETFTYVLNSVFAQVFELFDWLKKEWKK